MPKQRPAVKIGQLIRAYRSDRGLSQGDLESRTGLLRCYISRVENGHTVPSLGTLAKLAEAMNMSLADLFSVDESERDRETRRVLSQLSKDEMLLLTQIQKCSTALSADDKNLLLAVVRRMAVVIPSTRQR